MTTRHTISHADELYRGNASFEGYTPDGRRGVLLSHVYFYDLGAAAAADADGHVTSSAITSASPVTSFGGALGGTNDVPRNIVAAWTGTAIMTVTGTDEYGQAMSEVSASGTSFASTKAFKTVTSVAVSANVTGATVGTGDVFGLPVRVDNLSQVILFANNGIEDAAAFVAADTAAPTTSTGDVRGTIDPTTAANGTVRFAVWIHLPDVSTKLAAFGQNQNLV